MFDKNLSNEEKLDAIYKMTLENHEVLKTIRRQQFISGFIRLIYWIVIFGSIGATYYYTKPIIESLTGGSFNIGDTVQQFNQLKNQIPDAKVLNQLLEGVQNSPSNPQ